MEEFGGEETVDGVAEDGGPSHDYGDGAEDWLRIAKGGGGGG